MSKKQGHIYGDLESVKFDYRRNDYYKYLTHLKESEPSLEDLLHNFTAYIGHMSLNRLLTIYEIYKKTLGIAGHIADVGVYLGASSLLFAKLIKIFESESLTLCHGFDWFKGSALGRQDSNSMLTECYKSEYTNVVELVQAQGLANILKIHNLDLTKDLDMFFERHSHLRFKLIMMDCGRYDCMKSAIPIFYDRLIQGGIMIFDQYSHEFAPGETLAISEFLPDVIIRSIPNSWMPNAYIIKV